MPTGQRIVIDRRELDSLLGALRGRGYTVLGPRVRDGAITYDELSSSAELPAGWTDRQDAGRYRLEQRDDDPLFGPALGPDSWKRFLHPPDLTCWRARRSDAGFTVAADEAPPPRYAFLGVRPCELAAIQNLDRVLMADAYPDPVYRARREAAFLAVANCVRAGGTCFCASMKTGPRAVAGFDLALTELAGDGRHELLLESGSDRGAAVAAEVPHRPALEKHLQAADAALARAEDGMGRRLDGEGLKELLERHREDDRWQEVAKRCLTCGNCTLVCPTCFCTTFEDTTDLTGTTAERRRVWDSCFSRAFSYVHGGSVRASAGARYRHWITHKLAGWHDQFGSSGCVGCGRCITWCPAGIDITEEARALRQLETQGG